MGSELTTNGAALRLFFTDDIYLIKGEEGFSTEEVIGVVVQDVKSEDSADLSSANSTESQNLKPAGSNTPENIPTIPVVQEQGPVIAAIKEADPNIISTPVLPKESVEIKVPVIPAAIAKAQSDPVQAVVKEKKGSTFKFLGKNKKKILILVNDADHEVSDEAGRELLRKIVKSINLTASDFALLNYANYLHTDFRELQQYFSSVLVFAFGVSAADLQLPAHAENKIVMEGDVRLIFSRELKKLEQDPVGKKELWGSLKQLGL